MNKRLMFAMTGAIALAGSMGLGSCSSEDEVVDVNPTYNNVTNEVTTQFVLNVATAPNQFTRQSSATVQRASNFRGMQDAHLIGLSTGNSSWLAPFAGSSTGYTVNKTFELGTLYSSTAVDNDGNKNSESSSRRVLQLAMPINTDAMLVYARAIPSAVTLTENQNDNTINAAAVNGKVDINITAKPEEITFELCPRMGGRDSEYDQTCALAIKILNRIVDSEVPALSGVGQWSRNGYSNAAALPALSWKGLGAAEESTLTPLEENLAKAFKTLTTINTNEKRAGSSSAISSIAYYIYTTASSVYNATATNDGELNAQRLADKIIDRIKNYFEDYSVSETDIAFKNISNIKENMTGAGVINEADFNSQFGLVQHGDLKAFPTSFGLPLGVALLNYNATDGFTHKAPAISLLDDTELAEENYMYPAELLYFDNSALRVNSNAVDAANYPNGYNTWDTEGNWGGWTTGGVTSSTRSVAVKNNINYGVAMLQTKVALDGTSFTDNRNAITGESNQTLSADDVKNFKLTGIIVGNQSKTLGWNYLAKTAAAANWNYVVYDNKINGTGAVPTPTGEENYTLLFDNYTPDANQTSDVYVALEFQNNGRDFYGVGNMIRTGGTFYLVGKLTLENATNSITWPTNYAIPPYTAAGASQEVTRIFIQDFMTTATFKIGANSLKSAFVTVPDLRSSQTSLGLSVNLEWQTGLNFETVIGN